MLNYRIHSINNQLIYIHIYIHRCVCLCLLQVFSIFEQCKASVDVVASSDVSVSMTLDPKTASSVDMDRLMVRIL